MTNTVERLTFDAFVTGPQNAVAYGAAREVAEGSKHGKRFNPLYIYSPVGLGKTHLLHATAAHMADRGLSPYLATSNRFSADCVKATRVQAIYRLIDLADAANALLIDDIQFTAPQAHAALYELFNRFIESGRAIVVTGGAPPHELNLPDRLSSRCAGGLPVSIEPPGHALRLAILHRQADDLSVCLSMPVLEFLVRLPTLSVRDLVGALHRTVTVAQTTNAPITVELARRATDNLLRPRVLATDPAIVISAVAAHYGLDCEQVAGRQRDKFTALARRVAMYLLREESQLSSTRVGLALGGKDHSTVLYSQKHMEAQLEKDPLVRQDLATIRLALVNRAAA